MVSFHKMHTQIKRNLRMHTMLCVLSCRTFYLYYNEICRRCKIVTMSNLNTNLRSLFSPWLIICLHTIIICVHRWRLYLYYTIHTKNMTRITRHTLYFMIYLTALYFYCFVAFHPLCIMCEKWHLFVARIDIPLMFTVCSYYTQHT